MAKVTASGFSISGLLDTKSQTQGRFPVEEIPVIDIADHPANVAYSMDEAGIAQLARSISEEGLTDLPLVRKLEDGTWQMVSGHRRKAAYSLLAKTDPSYSKLPCRVVRDITDGQSEMLLHAANYFVRNLSLTERAAASRALGVEVERLRASEPGLTGMRTEDIKAAIISEQTGRKISGKTIQRQESLAAKIEEELVPRWRSVALDDGLSADAVCILAGLEGNAQESLYDAWATQGLAKKETTEFLKARTAAAKPTTEPSPAKADARLRSALRSLRKYRSELQGVPCELDLAVLADIASEARSIADAT